MILQLAIEDGQFDTSISRFQSSVTRDMAMRNLITRGMYTTYCLVAWEIVRKQRL
jgi:hypothetical protein